MDAAEILEALRGDYASLVNAAERRISRRMRRTAALAVFCAISAVSASAITYAAIKPAAIVSPEEQIVAAVHLLPSTSPMLLCIAGSVISCESTLDDDGMVVAVACVGRAGNGFGEAFLRRQLTHQAPRVRREAVVWYPVVNPAWETDPVGGPVYLQARASILGN